MRAPGFEKHPSYTITFEPCDSRIRVSVGETCFANSKRALLVTETRHRPVYYVPLADVDNALLEESATETYCPFKGKARYWSVAADGTTVSDALWNYPDPYDECERLRDYVAFYTSKVRFEIDGAVADDRSPGWTRRPQ